MFSINGAPMRRNMDSSLGKTPAILVRHVDSRFTHYMELGIPIRGSWVRWRVKALDPSGRFSFIHRGVEGRSNGSR